MRVATDIGGTFTDLVAVDDKGRTILTKSHTTPPNFEEGVINVMKKSGIRPEEISDFIHGTTTIINALTERKGAKTALITTKGFRDVLEIARCNRPDLFNMVFAKQSISCSRTAERPLSSRQSRRRTTAKYSLIDDGEVKVTTEYRIECTESYAGYPIMAPVVDIVEIGNGGGSIAWIDEAGSLKVGPQSAGALPGPVAYGIGGTEPTTTDACLVTGRLSPKNFDNEVDLEAVKAAIQEKVGDAFGMNVEEAAMSILRVAEANMFNVLKLISVRRGYDPRDFTMVAFGGGGPMHCAYLAKELNIRKVVVPIAAPVFSAWGMLMTDVRHDYIQTNIRRMNEVSAGELNQMWDGLLEEAYGQFAKEGVEKDQIIFRFIAGGKRLRSGCGSGDIFRKRNQTLAWHKEEQQMIIRAFVKTG